MREYTVRSTRTRNDSAARRVVDVLLIILICAAVLLFIFGVALVPARIAGSNVSELSAGDVILVDRVSKYLVDYAVGDIVRAQNERLLLPDDRTGITHLTGWAVPLNNVIGEVRFRVAPIKRLAFFY